MFYFSDNHISDDTLSTLEKTDLVEIVPSIGHRSKLWTAIKKINEGQIYVCFKCPNSFKTLNCLSSHLKSKHQVKGESEDYRCPHCSGHFQRRAYFNHFRNVFKFHPNLLQLNNLAIDSEVEYQGAYERVERDSNCLQKKSILSMPTKIMELELSISKLYACILESGKISMVASKKIISAVKESISKVIETCQPQ